MPANTVHRVNKCDLQGGSEGPLDIPVLSTNILNSGVILSSNSTFSFKSLFYVHCISEFCVSWAKIHVCYIILQVLNATPQGNFLFLTFTFLLIFWSLSFYLITNTMLIKREYTNLNFHSVTYHYCVLDHIPLLL